MSRERIIRFCSSESVQVTELLRARHPKMAPSTGEVTDRSFSGDSFNAPNRRRRPQTSDHLRLWLVSANAERKITLRSGHPVRPLRRVRRRVRLDIRGERPVHRDKALFFVPTEKRLIGLAMTSRTHFRRDSPETRMHCEWHACEKPQEQTQKAAPKEKACSKSADGKVKERAGKAETKFKGC